MAGAARVFISYSSKDAALVTRLKDDLARAGVDVWLDHERLTPGTPNWQAAVRAGIAQATTIIYSASPDAADSEYVGHELAIAKDSGKTILPFWVRGEQWSRCTPMGYYYAQHVDGRDAAYAVGLAALLVALGAVPTTQPAAPRYPLPDVPAHLASLGFRSVNRNGTSSIIPPLVRVAAGSFLMGSQPDANIADADLDAFPQHRVELTTFQFGKYPVTVAEYAFAVRAGAVREPPLFADVTWQAQLLHANHPVVCVSWQEAAAYVVWLRQVTGEPGWHLPSEAQWEKAARWDAQRGVSRIYPWGDRFDHNRCNTYESGIGTTSPVGGYPASDARHSGASPWGAEDMAGNVMEWTSSLYKSYPYNKSDGRENQDIPGDRILRGGSFFDPARFARSTRRISTMWDKFGHISGFRLACD